MMKAVLLLLVFGPLFIQGKGEAEDSDVGLDRGERFYPSFRIGCYFSTKPIGRNPREGDFSKKFASVMGRPGSDRCGMGTNFNLGKFTAAQCGTPAVRFCCQGSYCNVPWGGLVEKEWIAYEAQKIAEAINKGK